jgi:hypothetical protein
MRTLDSQIEIDAAASAVWEALADFPGYPAWNPFIPRISGEMTPGHTLEVRLEPPDGPAMTIKPKVLVSRPNREFRWLGHLLVPGIFDGEHIFQIEEIEAHRVRFIHREEFRGILAGLMLHMVGDATFRGFHAMNQALKKRVEA